VVHKTHRVALVVTNTHFNRKHKVRFKVMERFIGFDLPHDLPPKKAAAVSRWADRTDMA
jgi:hypothetical protein